MKWTRQSLPSRALQDRADRGLEARVGVRHHQLDAVEPADLQGAEELCPEGLVLGVADVEPQDFTASVSGDTDRDHDRL